MLINFFKKGVSMPKINLTNVKYSQGRYPEELMDYYEGNTDTYKQIKLGDLGGLSQFCVNKSILPQILLLLCSIGMKLKMSLFL